MSLPLPAADLAETAAAFARWRDATPLGARIPEDLRSRAVELAARHGVAKVAAALRLDYDGLKRRLTAQPAAAAPPAFVELSVGLPPGRAGVRPGPVERGRPLPAHRVGAPAGRRRRGGRAQPVGGGTIALTPQLRVWVATAPADFRCGIDGLARRVRQALGADPFGGALFVFRNRRGTAVKLLVYDGQGFWLCRKRLSQGSFRHWPSAAPGQVLAAQELAVLLAGGDWAAAAGAPVWRAVG